MVLEYNIDEYNLMYYLMQKRLNELDILTQMVTNLRKMAFLDRESEAVNT